MRRYWILFLIAASAYGIEVDNITFPDATVQTTKGQPADADLDDLADGTLTGAKVAQHTGHSTTGVVTSTAAQTNLFYRGDGTWQTAGGGASALDDLTDVNASAPSSGQVLEWNGSVWTNATDNTGTRFSYTTGTDADTAMAVNTAYNVDMSGWATSDRTYRLPDAASIGDAVQINILGGNASYELAIRTTTNSNDTIDGTDYDSTDWSKLFISGESVTFVCVTANSAWVTEIDGRIPCFAQLRELTDQNFTSGTEAALNFTSNQFDVGGIANTSTNGFVVRRDGNYQVYGTLRVIAQSVNYEMREFYYDMQINGTILADHAWRMVRWPKISTGQDAGNSNDRFYEPTLFISGNHFTVLDDGDWVKLSFDITGYSTDFTIDNDSAAYTPARFMIRELIP